MPDSFPMAEELLVQIKIFLACFLGAFIGTFVALQMNPALWWIGMLTGAFVGYVSHEFEVLIRTIGRSFIATFKWRPNKSFWRAYFSTGFGVVGLFHSIFALLVLSIWVDSGFSLVMKSLTNQELLQIFWAMVAFHFFLIFVGGPFAIDTLEKNSEGIYSAGTSYGKTNPVTIIFWYLPRGTWFILKKIPKVIDAVLALCIFAAVAGSHAVVEGFKLVHSNIRLLCALDAAIGTMVGYFLGNTIIGGIAGGILGVLDYELVSKRLLRVGVQR